MCHTNETEPWEFQRMSDATSCCISLDELACQDTMPSTRSTRKAWLPGVIVPPLLSLSHELVFNDLWTRGRLITIINLAIGG